MRLRGGFTNYGQDIGILMLDTVFPRIIGDIGNAKTFHFPVRYYTIQNISSVNINEQTVEQELLFPFIKAAQTLESQGCKAITTSCSFLGGFQRQLADSVSIPVFTTPLLLVPMLHNMLNRNKKIGIFTACAKLITEEYFLQAGWSSNEISVCVSDLPEQSPFHKLIIDDSLEEDLDVIESCIKELAVKHMKNHPDTGVIILECTNFTPFAKLIQDTTGVPVFGMNQLLEYMNNCINPVQYF